MIISERINVKLLERSKNTSRIVYNRVSKCGSETMLEVISQLSKRNGFSHGHSKIFNRRRIDKEEQEELVAEIDNMNEPFLYDRHVHLIDFSR